MRYTTFIILFLLGCSSETKEHKAFLKQYGETTRVFCDEGFKIRETYLSERATKPTKFLIDSQDCIK